MSKKSYTTIFTAELGKLLNKYSLESFSNTSDFILANYLTDCLKLFAKTVKQRDKWYNKKIRR